MRSLTRFVVRFGARRRCRWLCVSGSHNSKCMLACIVAKKEQRRAIGQPQPQPGNRLCNLDLLVFSYAVNSEPSASHSQDNGMRALVIHRGSGIRTFWCNQEYRLSSKHNRSGARRPRNLRMVGMRAFSVVRPPTDCPSPHQNLGHGSVRRGRELTSDRLRFQVIDTDPVTVSNPAKIKAGAEYAMNLLLKISSCSGCSTLSKVSSCQPSPGSSLSRGRAAGTRAAALADGNAVHPRLQRP